MYGFEFIKELPHGWTLVRRTREKLQPLWSVAVGFKMLYSVIGGYRKKICISGCTTINCRLFVVLVNDLFTIYFDREDLWLCYFDMLIACL